MTDPRAGNLGYWCLDACRTFPERVALIDLSGAAPREVTYEELDRRMDRVARLLESRGIGMGARVALSVGNRFEFVELMFGAMRAGAVPVPVNYKLGVDALGHVIEDAACEAAFLEPAVSGRVAEVVEGLGIVRRWSVGDGREGWGDYEEGLDRAEGPFEPPPLPDGHPAFQPYTSGSTGMPKGVVLTHSGQMWWLGCLARYWPASPDDRALAAVPLYHKNAMAGAVKPLLQAGGAVVILPGFEPVRFLRTLAEYRCTQVGAVPAVFTMVLDHRDLIESLDFSALTKVTLGSAPVQPELMDAVAEAFGVQVGESYGLTEGGPVMLGPPTDGRPVPKGSCGAAWPEGDVKLVHDGREDDSLGELFVRNPGVTPGYHNLPDVNRERLKDGWLATGDLFHRDDEGFFYFRGRTDDMFTSGGENIYPKEVENLLLSHPDVLDAAVVPVAHPVKGLVPGAMVKLTSDSELTEEALKSYALDLGPAYAHPRRILLVTDMPLSGAGKVDRGRVAELLADIPRA